MPAESHRHRAARPRPGGRHPARDTAALAQVALRDLPSGRRQARCGGRGGRRHPDFGGLTAVAVDHLEIQRGGITGLIGPNGAGKTTLFNLLTGFDQPDTGTWSFDGRRWGSCRPHQVARLGVVRTFQLTKALSRLTVLQNMLLGAQGQRGEGFLRALVPGMWRARRRRTPRRRWTC